LVWFRSIPLRTGFTDPLSEPPTFPTHFGPTHFGPTHFGPTHFGPTTAEPPLRVKLRSARYRWAALSLCYGGVAEPGRIERLTLRPLRLSKPFEEPTSAGSIWRKAAGADPQTFRSHSVSNGSPGPPGIAFPVCACVLCLSEIKWRSVIGIEPSAIAGRPVLQTPLRSQPRHAPIRPC
jgi:hypothetical protein